MQNKQPQKRPREEKGENSDSHEPKKAKHSVIETQFEGYAAELLDFQDRRERVIKASRDLTIGSKRLIFLLHRTAGLDQNGAKEIIDKAKKTLDDLHQIFARILVEFKDNGDFYRFAWQYSPGIQEYIEASLFFDFVSHCFGDNVPKEFVISDIAQLLLRINERLESKWTMISIPDYVLGLLDFTGELMRLCLNSTAGGDKMLPFRILSFIQNLNENIKGLEMKHRDFRQKVDVMQASVGKIEKVCYTIRLTKAEFPNADVKVSIE